MNLSNITPAQFRRAANLKEKIASLEKDLNALLGESASSAAPANAPRKRRKMSAAARKRISDAQKARWAKQKKTQK